MNEDLKEYIRIRRQAIDSILKEGENSGIIDGVELNRLHAILGEFEFMEYWFNE